MHSLNTLDTPSPTRRERAQYLTFTMAAKGNQVDPEKLKLLLEDQKDSNKQREKHFKSSETVRDIVLGVSDGLTVPFALAAGLSSANVPSSIIVVAGIAEVVAGAISMGLGGYLAAKSEAEVYNSELKRKDQAIIDDPELEAATTEEILSKYGIEPHESEPVVKALRRNPQLWVDFMIKFELGLEKPDPLRGLISGITIATSYMVGGSVPLLPYLVFPVASEALIASIALTIIALMIFGLAKGYFTGSNPFKSAIQTAFVGAFASAAAYYLAKLLKH
ncbi:vacuolar iron transporter 1-like [Durio zibethinus]|uniref:Vacuolar iron transporter n=1 Tax=Durio zibethinus TaxID=66656 RepID=A0A6P6BF39_DURZI|nr:vacuolar iron transporter 1-like [Durio zibethinus]